MMALNGRSKKLQKHVLKLPPTSSQLQLEPTPTTLVSARFQKGKPYYYAWYVAAGRAVNPLGLDFHGAGAVRFDTKHENGPAGEGGERYYNYVRVVRDVK